MSTSHRHETLRRILDSGEMLLVPGAYDTLSARIIEHTGFPAVYIGSYATAASAYGLPDTGHVQDSELIEQARRAVAAVGVPVLADGEGARHDASSVADVVRAFEDVGVSGIHIEDQLSGKHTDKRRIIRPLDEMCAMVEAAVSARQDENFLIIARTDSAWTDAHEDEVVQRLNAFSEAGADLVFPAGLGPDRLTPVRSQIRGKVVMTNWPGCLPSDDRRAGLSIVIYWGLALCAAFDGVAKAIENLAGTTDLARMRSVYAHLPELEALLGSTRADKQPK